MFLLPCIPTAYYAVKGVVNCFYVNRQRDMFPFMPVHLSPIAYDRTRTQSGVRSDVQIIAKKNIATCQAQGVNFSGEAVIYVSTELEGIDPDAIQFLFKHELSHIKDSDLFTIPIVQAASSMGAAILSKTLGRPASFILACTASYVAKQLFGRNREQKADNFAIANATVVELYGGLRYLKAALEIEKEELAQVVALMKRNGSIVDCLFFTSEGKARTLIRTHDSYEQRIQKVESELIKRGEIVDLAAILQDPKYEQLKAALRRLRNLPD